MHATLGLSQSIIRVLQYHELKVTRGQAELLDAGNFIKDAHELSYKDKLYHFTRLISLNEYSRKPVWHVFLGFNLADKVSNETMRSIARQYIEGMGFGGQPWLAYRHYDTLHDHVHLVSTTIQHDGKRIRLSLAGLKYSRELTHSLERRHGLDQGSAQAELLAQHKYLPKVKYGETSLYPTMNMVLETIVPHYNYTSLGELNAVLGLFNMKASRGRPDSQIYQRRGLVYYPLMSDGREGPAYIKASVFPTQPTLDNLERRFAENQQAQVQHRRRLRSTIDYALAGGELSFSAFQEAMAGEKINLVLQKDAGGGQTMWWVDHHTKTVFEGAALGAKYTTAGILQRCMPEETYQQQQAAREEQQHQEHRIRHSL
jgi:Relaxase/Mobilisation nuclease domain